MTFAASVAMGAGVCKSRQKRKGARQSSFDRTKVFQQQFPLPTRTCVIAVHMLTTCCGFADDVVVVQRPSSAFEYRQRNTAMQRARSPTAWMSCDFHIKIQLVISQERGFQRVAKFLLQRNMMTSNQASASVPASGLAGGSPRASADAKRQETQ